MRFATIFATDVPIALVPLWIVSRYGRAQIDVAMGVFLLLVFLMHVAGNVGGPAWVSWMADLVPGRVRGKYFSRRRQLGILPALPVALLLHGKHRRQLVFRQLAAVGGDLLVSGSSSTRPAKAGATAHHRLVLP